MKEVNPEVRSALNYDKKRASSKAALVCKDPSRTRQDQADEANINTIVRNFGITKALPQSIRMPTYGDFDCVGDYQSALQALRDADEAFLKLPSAVRSRFDNDPGRFIEFAANPDNLEECRQLGLAPPGAPPAQSST